MHDFVQCLPYWYADECTKLFSGTTRVIFRKSRVVRVGPKAQAALDTATAVFELSFQQAGSSVRFSTSTRHFPRYWEMGHKAVWSGWGGSRVWLRLPHLGDRVVKNDSCWSIYSRTRCSDELVENNGCCSPLIECLHRLHHVSLTRPSNRKS